MTAARLPFDEPVPPSMPALGGVENVPEALDRAQVACRQGRQKFAFVGDGRRFDKAVSSFKRPRLGTLSARIIRLPSRSSGASRA